MVSSSRGRVRIEGLQGFRLLDWPINNSWSTKYLEIMGSIALYDKGGSDKEGSSLRVLLFIV